MRKIATNALSLFILSSIAFAQLYSPLVQDPTLRIPTGDVFCLDINAQGSSLITSNAGNLVRDPAPGTQLYIVNAQGEAERIPLEKALGEARAIRSESAYGYYAHDYYGRISPNGKAALLSTRTGLYAYQRRGKTVRRIFGADFVVGFASETSALVARRVSALGSYQLTAWYEIYRYNFETGALTPVDLPAYPTTLERLFRLTDQGKTLVYAAKSGYYRVNLISGASTYTESSGPENFNSLIDQSGRYVYRLRPQGDDAVLERQRIGSAEVELIRTLKGVGGSVYIMDASESRVLLATGFMLSPLETTFGWDAYFVDVATGELSLASKGPDGKPVDDLPTLTIAAFLSPKGEAVYVSQRKDLTTPNHPDWKFPYRATYRQAPGELPTPLVKAVTGGGSHIAPYEPSFQVRKSYEVSRNDRFALVRTLVPGQEAGSRLLLRDLRTNADSKVIVDDPALEPTPSDVTFDGRYAAYFHLDGSGDSRLYVYDTVENRERWATRILGTNKVATYGRFDTGGLLYFIADATGSPSGETGNWLFRYDPSSDALTPLQAVADTIGFGDVSVGGGWVAYLGFKDQSPRVTVVKPTTGKTTVVLNVRRGSSLGGATITSDGKRIAIPWIDANAFSNGTALYDLPSGTEQLGNLPSGKLTTDGQWLLGYLAIYLPTGAKINTDARFAAIGGRGPETFGGNQNGGPSKDGPFGVTNDRGLDLYRYSFGIPTSPEIYDTAVTSFKGRLSISAKALEAGLRAAKKTSIEYQIDGGEWRGIPQPDDNGLTRTVVAAEGSRVVGLRARDSLGRTSEIQSFPVKVDATKPVVSHASAKVEGTSVTVRFTLSEYAGVSFRYGIGNVDGNRGIDVLPPGTYERTLTGLEAGKTYTLRVEAIDGSSNVGTSKTLTFTTGS